MSAARLVIGDVFERMAELPDASVDVVLTSPPFLALRSYLPADHPDKDKEIGSEPTPAEFLGTLLALTAEWGRVLAPHGSICIELGDTYAGSGGSGGDYAEGGMREGQIGFRQQRANTSHRTHPDGSVETTPDERRREKKNLPRTLRSTAGDGWPLDKSLCGIPHLYHLSLAYGRNLLTGEPSPAGAWRVRNIVAWCRPNPSVGALGDKYRPATSYMTIATRARDRYFDLDAVRFGPDAVKDQRARTTNGPKQGADRSEVLTAGYSARVPSHPGGRPPYDHVGLMGDEADLFTDDAWLISTQPYKGAHYATWPKALLARPIKAMCPQRVCTTCGEPSRRVLRPVTLDAYRSSTRPQTIRALVLADAAGLTDDEAKAVLGGYVREFTQTTTARRESSWTDCCCGPGCVPPTYEDVEYPPTYRDDGKLIAEGGSHRVMTSPGSCDGTHWRNGLILDPFVGSGTTLEAAIDHGRDAIGIDLDSRNADLARERVGMFLTVEEPEPA